MVYVPFVSLTDESRKQINVSLDILRCNFTFWRVSFFSFFCKLPLMTSSREQGGPVNYRGGVELEFDICI